MENKETSGEKSLGRIEYIDNIKGIACVLVVLGHAIQAAVTEFDSNLLFKMIYSFHMPLFMFASGLTLFSVNKNYDHKWLIKKFEGLIIPFVAWMLIPRLITNNWSDFPEYLYKVFWKPDNARWFLLSLFLNHLVFYCVRRVLKRISIINEIVLDGLCVAFFFVVAALPLPLNIKSIWWYYIFYILGYYTRKYSWFEIGQVFSKRIVFICCLGVWLLLLTVWNRSGACNIIKIAQYNGIMISFPFDILIDKAISLMIALAGILWISLLIIRLTCIKRFTDVIGMIGRNTLEVYVLQSFFFNIILVPIAVIQIIVNCLCGVFLPCLVSHWFKNHRINMLLFGKR